MRGSECSEISVLLFKKTQKSPLYLSYNPEANQNWICMKIVNKYQFNILTPNFFNLQSKVNQFFNQKLIVNIVITASAFCLYQQTPLHVAAREGHEHTMKAFLGKTSDVDIKDKDGVSVYKRESAKDCFSYTFVPRLSCMGREMKDWYTLFGNLFLLP